MSRATAAWGPEAAERATGCRVQRLLDGMWIRSLPDDLELAAGVKTPVLTDVLIDPSLAGHDAMIGRDGLGCSTGAGHAGYELG